MLKNLLYILIFNAICLAHPFDVYGISDHKTVENIIKRELEDGGRERIPAADSPTVKKDLETHITADDHKNPTDEHKNVAKQSSAQNQKDLYKIETSAVEKHQQKSNATVTDDSEMPGINIVKNFKIDNPPNLFPIFYAFVGCSVLVLIFFVVRSFRLRSGAPAAATVRKYGIVGRRSDMEMLPLPLAEEEDDDTLFDMGTQINR